MAAGCPGMNILNNCGGREKRQSNGGVVFNVSFPAVMDPVRNTATKQEATVRAVMEALVFWNKQLNFGNQLPNAVVSAKDVVIEEGLVCPAGNVLKDGNCLVCTAGTFLDGGVCRRCERGECIA